jgi:single-strand DNA-binding protein
MKAEETNIFILHPSAFILQNCLVRRRRNFFVNPTARQERRIVMPSLNRVVLIGRLTRDPELRYTTSGLAVATFTLAVDRRYKNQQGERQTDFLRCKAWRQKAEFVSSYVTKGRLVAVEGSIEISEVEGQDGQKKYFTDIVCDNVETLESREQSEGSGGGHAGSTPAPARAPQDNAPQGDQGNGYFPDDDMAAAPPQRAPQQPRPQGAVNPNAAAARPAPTRAPQGNRPAPAPQPAYPENDFDDSDPFADE